VKIQHHHLTQHDWRRQQRCVRQTSPCKLPTPPNSALQALNAPLHTVATLDSSGSSSEYGRVSVLSLSNITPV
jgi:hypothetical protein